MLSIVNGLQLKWFIGQRLVYNLLRAELIVLKFKKVVTSIGIDRDIRQDASFTSFPEYSSPHPAMIKKNGLTFILTYSESELLLAEASQRWGIAGSASDHYAEGVKKAITFLSQYDADIAITDGVAANFVTANPYNPANGLQQIN